MMPLALISLALLGIRLYAASKVGFGDSEALYAAYAAHPQPTYLDHPGLVGMAMKAIGPTPERVHTVTAVLATMVPWFIFFVSRSMGAKQRPAMMAAIATAFVPEIAVGLFGMTPDLLLAPLWIGAIGLAQLALTQTGKKDEIRAAVPKRSKYAKLAKERAEEKDNDAAREAESNGVDARVGSACFLGAGLLAGVACSAKASGLLLVLSLIIVYARSKYRRSAAPWIGLLAGSVVLVPLVQFEAANGFPMFKHRLVETQAGAGVALRNLGALVGGQLLYLSPGIVVLVIAIARSLWKKRAEYPLLFATFVVPFVPLLLLCIWSRVAEPHWLAPAFLSLPLYAAVHPEVVTRARFIPAVALAALVTLVVHAYVLVPESAKLMPGDAKYDIASELYGWQTAADAIENQRPAFATPWDPAGADAWIVGPHWTVCAQIAATMPNARVGCATDVPDDFDRWLPRKAWKAHDRIIWVTDNRFPNDGQAELPDHVRVGQSRVRVFRGGKSSRTFEVILYDKRAGAMVPSPASRMSAMSSLSSGFGVVSSVSP